MPFLLDRGAAAGQFVHMRTWSYIPVGLICAFSGATPSVAGTISSMPVQLVDAGALTQTNAFTTTAKPVAAAAQATGLVPAPVPDPDAAPPNTTGTVGPSLNPAFFARPVAFQGNGFAESSNLDHSLRERQTPAAGLNLSVPVK
jgi:hypothetical protein